MNQTSECPSHVSPNYMNSIQNRKTFESIEYLNHYTTSPNTDFRTYTASFTKKACHRHFYVSITKNTSEESGQE